MNKQSTRPAPKLRFPQFRQDEGWEEDELENIAVFLKGKGIAKSDVVKDGALACIRYGELYTYYQETINKVISYTNVPPDDLMLSRANDVIIPASGETREDIATASCVTKDGIALGSDLNVIRSRMNGVFLSYYLNNAKKKEIAKLAQGNAVVHLYSSQLKKLKIHIPIIGEQQKIADCLSALDELITTQNQKLDKVKAHKKGLMQQLFPADGETVPKLRFPEFRGTREWEKETFGDVLQFQTGFPFDSGGFNNLGKGIRLIRNRDLKSDDSIVFYSKLFDEKFIVHYGDILVGMDGDFTPCVWNKGKALLNQRVGRVLVRGENSLKFLHYYLTIHLKTIEETTARTTVKHLSHSDVEKIREPLPSHTEQQKIAECLSSLDELITAQNQKLNALKIHKRGLMQGLFPSSNDVNNE